MQGEGFRIPSSPYNSVSSVDTPKIQRTSPVTGRDTCESGRVLPLLRLLGFELQGFGSGGWELRWRSWVQILGCRITQRTIHPCSTAPTDMSDGLYLVGEESAPLSPPRCEGAVEGRKRGVWRAE